MANSSFAFCASAPLSHFLNFAAPMPTTTSEAITPMMPMTTSSSTSVKPCIRVSR